MYMSISLKLTLGRKREKKKRILVKHVNMLRLSFKFFHQQHPDVYIAFFLKGMRGFFFFFSSNGIKRIYIFIS